MKQIAEELGVRYVVEGSVRKDGDRVRITAQLNDVATGSHLWAERYDRELADVFAVQDEITETIVAAIEPQLYAAENFRAQRKPPDSLDAWDLVMRALSHYWRVTRQDQCRRAGPARKGDRDRPELRPGARACSAPATCSRPIWAGWTWRRRCRSPSARRSAAIRADGEDPWAHNALGHVYLFARRFEDSLAEFETALRLNPNFALAQGYYGLSLSYCGRWQDADEAARRALRLSPRDPYSAVYFGIAAYARFLGGDYEEAMRLAREALRQRSDFVGAHRVLTAAAGMAGQAEIAAAALAGVPPRAAQRFARLDREQCRSSWTPTGSTISKASAAPAWTRSRLAFDPAAVLMWRLRPAAARVIRGAAQASSRVRTRYTFSPITSSACSPSPTSRRRIPPRCGQRT